MLIKANQSKTRMVGVFLSILVFFTAEQLYAQDGRDLVSLDYLFVGAHPDDEGGFTGTMARYNLDEGFRGSVATFTLGEGGGNAIGPETGAALGLIRFEEMRRSLSLAGVDRFYFLGLEDFYFTQSAELTHDIWSAQNATYLCELIRVIRLTRPEVLVTMWPGPGTHGHHQMAARSAIIAFRDAANPSVCASLVEEEFLDPWQPLKIYISPVDDRYSIEVPLDEYSRTANMTYAEYRAIALRNYRSQGWDRWNTLPVIQRFPERRQLLKSFVPVGYPEHHLLEGTHIAVGGIPPGVELQVSADEYSIPPNGTVSVEVRVTNHSGKILENISLKPDFSSISGWTTETPPVSVPVLQEGETIRERFEIVAPETSYSPDSAQLWVYLEAMADGIQAKAGSYVWLRFRPLLEVSFKPLMDIENYHEFSREHGIEWLIPNLKTRVPLTIGQENEVSIGIRNHGSSRAQGELQFRLPDGIEVRNAPSYDLAAGEAEEVTATLYVDVSALPDNRQSVTGFATVSVSNGSITHEDEADLYLLPSMDIPRVSEAPAIDGDLSDMEGFAGGIIGPDDLWLGSTDGPDDSRAEFFLGYDDDNLYVGIRVYDDQVMCHMPPDRVRSHWKGDAVEITIDPSGRSTDTSTTFKVSIFPCSTEGFEPNAARYGDAFAGAIAYTAPGMEVASQQTEDGYVLEMLIPWSEMPDQPEPGDLMGLNILVYDAEADDPEPGADIAKSRIGWGAVIGAQQATTYLWPRVRLAR